MFWGIIIIYILFFGWMLLDHLVMEHKDRNEERYEERCRRYHTDLRAVHPPLTPEQLTIKSMKKYDAGRKR